LPESFKQKSAFFLMWMWLRRRLVSRHAVARQAGFVLSVA
jgi:hypothetical protein